MNFFSPLVAKPGVDEGVIEGKCFINQGGLKPLLNRGLRLHRVK